MSSNSAVAIVVLFCEAGALYIVAVSSTIVTQLFYSLFNLGGEFDTLTNKGGNVNEVVGGVDADGGEGGTSGDRPARWSVARLRKALSEVEAPASAALSPIKEPSLALVERRPPPAKSGDPQGEHEGDCIPSRWTEDASKKAVTERAPPPIGVGFTTSIRLRPSTPRSNSLEPCIDR